MKAEHIKLIIDGTVQVFMWGIAILGCVQGWQVYWKEKSLGKSAVIKMKEEHAAVKKEVEELKKQYAHLSDEISSVESQYDKLIERMINNFPFKQ